MYKVKHIFLIGILWKKTVKNTKSPSGYIGFDTTNSFESWQLWACERVLL